MVFSSLVFVSIFLPVTLLASWALRPVWAKNALLLAASLLFYAYGEPVYVFLMIGSAFMNYLWARLIERYRQQARIMLALSVVMNLGILGVYKYAGFLVELWNGCTGTAVPVPRLALPIGISFFTFQAMSYVFDVYRREVASQKNFVHILLYISFFPQLIAGPIVKYHDIDRELAERHQTLNGTAEGFRRFIFGLAKKVLIANIMGAAADACFGAGTLQVNAAVAWIGAASYMLQIYFDFSGYSDMAIGLGWMFGFHFKENFRHPYTAVSVRDFWKRWHISLSGWFKEYLYIPLGGNRKGRVRTCINKFIVFLCTGIWHGANVTFLFWGAYHGFFLMLEEYLPFFKRERKSWGRCVSHIYALMVVLIGFVFFRADTMGQGLFWVREMFTGFHFEPEAMRLCLSLLTPLNITVFAAGIAACLPFGERFREKKAAMVFSWAVSPLLLFLCMLSLAGGTYNPFIYFRF
ncbi:MAG TPA: MBOAT family protein [Lachnospiraceae bacterium]|nr:MBOAT family protein [Lachnospiraceae bacterium]